MHKLKATAKKAVLTLAVCAYSTAILAQTTDPALSINVSTTTPVGIYPFYTGLASNEAKTTWRYTDPLFTGATQALHPKMIRWPGGSSAKFDWKTGDIPTKFIERSIAFGLDDTSDTKDEYKGQAINRSKGGTSLLDFSNLLLAPNNAKAIVTINSVTDIPEFPGTDYAASARELAKYVRDNEIRVAYFDLMNEPYLQKKAQFFSMIGQELGMSIKPDEHLGHYNGRVYVAWVKLFNDAIKSELPDAKTAVMFSPGKLVTATYGGETDDDYSKHFDAAIWDYSKNNGAFWDAISFHWYPAAAGADSEQTATEVKEILSGNVHYLEEVIKNYYIANNTYYTGKPDMPILISEFNVSSSCMLNGTLFNALYLCDVLTRLTKISQVKNVDIQSLAPNSALAWGAFRLYKTFDWQDIAIDAYHSTPDSVLPSIVPFQNQELLSFTTFPDNGRPSGILDMSKVTSIPGYSQLGAFKNYKIFYSAHGQALQFLNKMLSTAQHSYDVEVTGGVMASIAFGEQPASPVVSEIGTSILLGDALSMRAFREYNGTGSIVIVNKSDVPHKVTPSWGGKLITGEIKHDWIASDDYLAENTDKNMEMIVSYSETVMGEVNIPPYSVNVITLGVFPRDVKTIVTPLSFNSPISITITTQ